MKVCHRPETSLIPWLVAVALYAADYHQGQGSDLYRQGCRAQRYLRQNFQIRDPFEWIRSSAIRRSYRAMAWRHYRRLRSR